MSTKPKNRDRRGRRRGGSRRSDRNNRRPDRPKPPCAMCGEPIGDITNALSGLEDGKPVHFDCALKAAVEKMHPEEGETVIYLGKGGFAVVDSQAYQQRRLKIIRRMDWEDPDTETPWRTELRTDVS